MLDAELIVSRINTRRAVNPVIFRTIHDLRGRRWKE